MAKAAFKDDAKVKVLAKGNPKTKGSASYKRFAKYKSGMTVAAALKAGITRGDLRWDVERAFISIR
jgi:hypothetical protein